MGQSLFNTLGLYCIFSFANEKGTLKGKIYFKQEIRKKLSLFYTFEYKINIAITFS